MTIYFGLEPFEPGNMMYVGIAQEQEDYVVDSAYNYISAKYGENLTVEEMEQVFEKFDIDYPLLAQYNKDKFDEFNIVE